MVPSLMRFNAKQGGNDTIKTAALSALLYCGPFSMFQGPAASVSRCTGSHGATGTFGHTIDPVRYVMGSVFMVAVGYPADYTFTMHNHYLWIAAIVPFAGVVGGICLLKMYFIVKSSVLPPRGSMNHEL